MTNHAMFAIIELEVKLVGGREDGEERIKKKKMKDEVVEME